MFNLLVGFLIGLGIVAHSEPGLAAETVPLYVGYADPPYSTAHGDSLTTKLAADLSALSHNHYRFQAVQLPRKRLNAILANDDWNGVVAWANPAWFDDTDRRRYAWSTPYMTDANLVVSRRDQPVEFAEHGNTLIGLRVGCIAGQRYPDLEQLFTSGAVTRADVASELQNLRKLRLGRVDAVLVQASSMDYFSTVLPDLDQWAHVARTPRNTFQRYLFTSRKRPDLALFLDEALQTLARDATWQGRLGGDTRRTISSQATAPQ